MFFAKLNYNFALRTLKLLLQKLPARGRRVCPWVVGVGWSPELGILKSQTGADTGQNTGGDRFSDNLDFFFVILSLR